MATTINPTTQIARLALATYGIRLGDPSMSAAVSALGALGDAASLMNALYARDLGSLTTAAAAARIVDNIGIDGDARATAVAYLQARLDEVPAAQRGTVVVQVTDGLAGLTADPIWGVWASRFNTEVARVVQLGGAQDVYLRPSALEQHYAPWVPVVTPPPTGGGDHPPGGGAGTDPPPTGGGDPPPTGGSGSSTLLDLTALSNQTAARIGSNSLATEGLEVVLSRDPSTKVRVDASEDSVIQGSEVTTVTPVLGVDNLTTGGANETVTLTQNQLRVNAVIDLGEQQDNTVFGTLREGADSLTLVHADLDNNSVVDAADAPLRPTLALSVLATGVATISVEGGALFGQKAAYTLRGVERLDLTQAASSDRFDDKLNLSGLAAVTANYGSALAVGRSNGGGFASPSTVGQLDANTLDAGGVAPVLAGLGTEWMTIGGLRLIEHVTGSPGNDRIVLDVNAAMQNVGSGAFALADSPVRTHLDRSTTVANGQSETLSRWEDQGLYRFDLAAGTADTLDYFAETASVTVAVATTGAIDRVFVGAAGAGGERVDMATNVERYFGGHGGGVGQNWIDLSAATVATTVEFSSLSGGSEVAEPNGELLAGGTTRGHEVRPSDGGAALAVFFDRTGAGSMAAAEWNNVQGSPLAETVILSDNDSGITHRLQLDAGANRVDYRARSLPVSAQIGAVNVASESLLQAVTVDSDTLEQMLGVNPATDRLTLLGSLGAGDTLDVTALVRGSVVQANPARPTTSQVDPDVNVVDLANGRVTESLFGQYVPAGGAVAQPRGFVTLVGNFEAASNAADNDPVHLLGNTQRNVLTGGDAADLIVGGRGSAGSASTDVGPGQRGDRLTGGGGGDAFLLRAENESPGGSIAGGQQASTNFGNNEFNVVNARDTITDFAVGADKLMFAITDAHDAVRVSGTVPASLAGTLNSVAPMASSFAAGSLTADIPRSTTSGVAAQAFDNYAVDTSAVTLTLADLVLRVAGSSGGEVIDASAGLAIGALGAASADGLRVDLVYSAASQSQASGYDLVVHFTSGSDKVDISFLHLPRLESEHSSQGLDFDTNGNNIVDALESGVVRTLGGAPTFSINAPAANLFIDSGIYRPVVVQAGSTGGGTSCTALVDANASGGYEPDVDMVIVLVGVASVASGDFIVDLYGGGWS